MCSVFGVILSKPLGGMALSTFRDRLNHLISTSAERGRDGFGMHAVQEARHGWSQHETDVKKHKPQISDMVETFRNNFGELAPMALVGNCRAEPTTEWVQEKTGRDQQPYSYGKWTIVHNGTIANDKELRTGHVKTKIDSAAIVELLDKLELDNPDWNPSNIFKEAIAKLDGSYAILAIHDSDHQCIYHATNYRPLWYSFRDGAAWFASSRDYLPWAGHMVAPYSIGKVFYVPGQGFGQAHLDTRKVSNRKALVVCSGGLDSVVAATKMISDGYQVSLAHFSYGSRAQGPEHAAIEAVAEHLGVKLHHLNMDIYKPEDSPLLQADSKIAGGEEGAEFAHEWVPARNLVMLALATAFCEANGFEVLALGNNLEEAGAYPDNEPEFIRKFDDLLPFAIGANKRLNVVMPVGNLMKHEIVKLGLELGAPLHLTWSCYRAGEQHCGTCGPCFMRKTAFKINGAEEVIAYEKG